MSDTIRRIQNKTECYTVMLNECLQRPDLSARAKGLYAYLMTLPNDWKLYRDELVTHFTEGKDALNTAFRELETAGYIHKERKLNQGKFDGWDYTIYESSTITGKPDSGKPQTEKPYTGNPQLLNTNLILNTNKQNTYNKPRQKQKPVFVPPTETEVQEYVKEKALAINPKSFYDYYSALDWKDRDGNQVKSWKGKAVSWHTREVKSGNSKPFYHSAPKPETRLCPHCHVPLRGSACPQCFANFDMNGREI